MAAGAGAIFGLPGLVAPMRLETDALDYIDRDLPLWKDTRKLEAEVAGLSVVHVRVEAPEGSILDPELLRGLEAFARRLEVDARVGSVTGPTTVLRWMRYVRGGDDRLPVDPAAWPKLAADLEGLLLTEPGMRATVDVAGLSDARLTVILASGEFEGVEGIRAFVGSIWDETASRHPALASCSARVVGQGILQAKIAEFLVPTLTESFALTSGIIFVAFLVVFRSGAARLMAMIPSLFAILVMFLAMRLFGLPLNVATILIASTVLGASENDQIHFFYHFQEARRSESTERALRHALLIAGRAILFATLINAGGFLALALSDLPPMRQFGIVASGAFVLSMAASFFAIPSALWIFFRERPDGHEGDELPER
jgi:predicted RND superfamily exporter protein